MRRLQARQSNSEPEQLRTFKFAVPERVMIDIIEWTDRLDLGQQPQSVAVFLAHLGNVKNWQTVDEREDRPA